MLIKLDSIVAPERTYDDKTIEFIQSLAESIKEKGLLHPIRVSPLEGGKYELVAGAKRLDAFKLLKAECIECQVKKVESIADLNEISIHENLIRENLPWYEEVCLRAELHKLRQAIHGKTIPDAGVKTGWGLKDTARELNMSFGVLSEDIRLAAAVIENPELKKIKDKKTALRVIRQNAQRLESEQEANAPVNVEVNQLICGNSLEILKTFPDLTFNACITDPPWINFHGEEKYESDKDTALVFREIYRTLQYNSFMYAFVGYEDFKFYSENLPKVGFKVQASPIIWWKPNVVTMGRRAWEHTRDLELIILGVKGDPLLVESGNVSSVLKYNAIPGQFLKHPNEKPLEIITKLLSLCTYEGNLVLDPFMGSGTVPDACRLTNRRYIGIERDAEIFMTAKRRLECLK